MVFSNMYKISAGVAFAVFLYAGMVLADDIPRSNPTKEMTLENKTEYIVTVEEVEEKEDTSVAIPEVVESEEDMEPDEDIPVAAPAEEESPEAEVAEAEEDIEDIEVGEESTVIAPAEVQSLEVDVVESEEKSYAKDTEPIGLAPQYVRELTDIEQGHNDSNPVWSLSGAMIAFERTIKEKKEIIIALTDGSIMHKIYYQQSDDNGEFDFFLPGLIEDISYNAGISWSPAGDRFVFMSNGATGNYDLYLGGVGSDTITRLTEHPEKDGQAHWSPVDEKLVFISGRSGKADVYLMDIPTSEVKRLTWGDKSYLYPQWSSDGKKIAMIYGSNENHDIYIIEDVTRPSKTCKPLTTWTYDDLRPVWSPDGEKIAFYSNYNPDNDPKLWSIVVVAADGSDPKEGEGLAHNVVASDVIPDVERGPTWMPDSNRIVYVKDYMHAYNPIYIVDVNEKASTPIKTDTRINHDVACSVNGTIAFRAQVEQWDHIYFSKLRN